MDDRKLLQSDEAVMLKESPRRVPVTARAQLSAAQERLSSAEAVAAPKSKKSEEKNIVVVI
jgi:hypothetical protein